MASSGRPPLLLTNYRGGGIGDFGLTLEAHLRLAVPALERIETAIDGRGAVTQACRAAAHRGPLIANLGLTAWGRSGPRNFLGFAAVGAHRTFGRPTVVIVHHAIEIFDLTETGYEVSRLVKVGAHAALARVRKCDLLVFSPRLAQILTDAYGARRVELMPLPGDAGRPKVTDHAPGRGAVVHAGYWAPYKGIDEFLGLAERLNGRADFQLVGRPHSALSSDPVFQRKVEGWKSRAQRAGVGVPGFLSPEQLDATCTGATIGVLSYTSASGASASFNLFADRGVPVIATDLPEFRYLERLGAGIVIAPSSPDGLATSVETLLRDRALWLQLSRRQVAFVNRYSWAQFARRVVDLSRGVAPTAGPGP